MDRTEKIAAVDNLRAELAAVQSFIVAHYHGLSVNDVQSLRGELRDAGGSMRVVKNSLARRALASSPHEVGIGLFSGPCAVGYCVSDPTVVPRVFKKFRASNEAFSVVGGVIDGVLLSPSQVGDLADLPSMDALRAKLIGVISAPAQRLASLLTQPGAGIARVLNARSMADSV